MSHSSQENDPVSRLHEEPPGSFPIKTVAVAVIVALAGLAAAAIPRFAREKETEEYTKRVATPTVAVVHPAVAGKRPDIILPASVAAAIDAPVFARTNGYVKVRKVDIGARVKAGDLLAEIDAPEVDAQLAQAHAALERAKADLALAKTTNERIGKLKGTDAVSQQEIDDKSGDMNVKAAAKAAAEADVVRLEQLVSFRHITAPFDGIVTERNTDIGDLINSGATGAKPLFRVADMSKLRVFVNVPEADASGIALGDKAKVEFTATPGVSPTGEVVRTAGAIDPASRTMLVEICLKNVGGKLMPGGYARVTIPGKGAAAGPVVPVNTVFFRGKSQVGVVKADDTVELRDVVIGRNYGTTVEIVEGLTSEDRVIANPPDSLVAGMKVRVAAPAVSGDKK